MLHQLSIRDFAIVDAVDIELGEGMTAITGETGAGKSLLVNALNLLLGGRADSALVRAGAREATVSGLFSLGQGLRSERIVETLRRAGLIADDQAVPEEMLVRRCIAAGGRGRAFIDDIPITLRTLREVMQGVIDIMSQHEHQSLLARDQQRDLLDAYGGHGPLRARVAELYGRLRELWRQRQKLQMDERERLARVDYLRYQVREFEEADPGEGEVERLQSDRRRLGAMDRLRRLSSEAEALLYEDDRSALSLVDEAVGQLRQAQELDAQLESPLLQAQEAAALLSEAGRELAGFISRLEEDPGRLDEVETRLELLHRLARKHGVSVDELVAIRAKLSQELGSLDDVGGSLDSLSQQIEALQGQLGGAAERLSRARRKAAKKLQAACAPVLAELAMGEALIQVQVAPLGAGDERLAMDIEGQVLCGRQGCDQVEFLLQANPGEPARPLGKVASGGELSRVALALRRILSGGDPVPTYVFDEVDAAIGGATADAVGQALRQVACEHQVLCITHQAQVASRAHHQLHVSKHIEADRTQVSVRELNEPQRVEELARMLGGGDLKSATQHARSLLQRGAA